MPSTPSVHKSIPLSPKTCHSITIPIMKCIITQAIKQLIKNVIKICKLVFKQLKIILCNFSIVDTLQFKYKMQLLLSLQ